MTTPTAPLVLNSVREVAASPAARYGKAITSILAAALVALVAATTDGTVTTHELVLVAIAVVGAVGIHLVPNLDAGPARYAKGITAAVAAALAVLVTVLTDGVTASEWLTVLLQALGAVGVVIVPNAARVLREPDADGVYPLTDVVPADDGPDHLAP